MEEFYLKILSGSHIGAEIPLEPGRYTLGKGDHCDLILSDLSLSDIEITIVIAPDGTLSISTENESPLYLNGSPEGKTLSPEFFDVITSSSVHFTLGPADAHWPEIEIPSLQKTEAKNEQNKNSEDNDEAESENDFPDPDASDDEDNNTTSEQPLSTDDNDPDLEADEDDNSEIDTKWLAGISVAFILVMSILAFFLFSEPEKPLPENVETPMEQAQSIKDNMQLDNVKFRNLPDGTILIRGYTQTREIKEELLNKFKDKKIAYRSQVIVINDMTENAAALLKDRGYKSLSVEQDTTPGSLILSGYVISTDELDKVTNMLTEEVYGLTSVVDNVESQAGRVKSLKSMLKDKGLALRVHLVERPGKILIQGTLLDQGQAYQLSLVANKFQSLYNDQPALIVVNNYSEEQQAANTNTTRSSAQSNTTRKKPKVQEPLVLVRGVSMGITPYLITQDGGKYLIGAKLDNGYIIEDINLDYLLLSDGVEQVKYHLGGKSSEQITKEKY